MTLTIYFLFFILIIIAFYVAVQDNHINALLSYGAFGTIISLLFFTMNAPDVAIVNLTVGAAFIFFIYVIAIKKVAKVKIYFISAPYLVEFIDGQMKGFEHHILKEFLDEKRLDVDYIEIESEKAIEILKKKGDILIGGFVVEEDIPDVVKSEHFLPTKLISFGHPLKTDFGTYYKNIERQYYKDFENDFVVDVIRFKYLMYTGKKFETAKTTEILNTGYTILFSKNKEFLAKEFDEYLLNLKNDKDYYNELIRRYIG